MCCQSRPPDAKSHYQILDGNYVFVVLFALGENEAWLNPLQVKVAETVCARFTSSRRPVARKELVLLVRDGYVPDEMANRTLIRTDANRAQYFPTLGTFALLNDKDERLIAAHEATVRILRILLRLYETRDASHIYTPLELVEEVRLHESTVNPKQVRSGLYLSITEFGAIQGWKPSDDDLDCVSVTIAGSVLNINASLFPNSRETPLVESVKTLFDQSVIAELLGDVRSNQ